MNRAFATIEDLVVFDDGRAAVAFKREMERIVFDLSDRAGVEKERSVTLKVTLSPEADERGDLAHVDVNVEIKSAIPSQRTRTVVARVVNGENTLLYNDLSPDQPRQRTIDQELARKENTK
jgi:hypothetical protein